MLITAREIKEEIQLNPHFPRRKQHRVRKYPSLEGRWTSGTDGNRLFRLGQIKNPRLLGIYVHN